MGFGDKVVIESKECVCVVLVVIGFGLLLMYLMVNLVFVDFLKEGSYYDLLIVFGFLIVMEVLLLEVLECFIVIGELVFDGMISFVVGVLFVVIVVNGVGWGFICL